MKEAMNLRRNWERDVEGEEGGRQNSEINK